MIMLDKIVPCVVAALNSTPNEIAALISTVKTGIDITYSVRNYFLLEKLETYFIEFKYDTISDDDRQKFFDMLTELGKTPEKLSILVIIILDRLDRGYKAKYLAKLVKALQGSKISYTQFEDMSKILENWFESDTDTLKTYMNIYNANIKQEVYEKPYTIEFARRERLVAQGIIIPHISNKSTQSDFYNYEPSIYAHIMMELINVQAFSTDFSTRRTGGEISYRGLIKSTYVMNGDEGL